MKNRLNDFSLGIEEEYFIVDKETGDLVYKPSNEMKKQAKDQFKDRVSYELKQCMIEVNTSPNQTVQSGIKELTALREELSDCLSKFDYGIMAASTHPTGHPENSPTTNLKRYRSVYDELQAIAENGLICGAHYHAGISDRETQIDLMNQIRYFLPHLLMFTTSSPFYNGGYTGMKSYRTTLFRCFPRTGVPEVFNNYNHYENVVRVMQKAKVIEDASKIWIDIRPSLRNPTLELRVSDICTNIKHTASIAALYLSLLKHFDKLRKEFITWRDCLSLLIEENIWRASRYGYKEGLVEMKSSSIQPVSDALAELLEMLQDSAEELGCLDELNGIKAIIEQGTSADTQYQIYSSHIEKGESEEQALSKVNEWLVDETLNF